MIRLLRIVGFLLIAAGLLLAASWFIEPLRQAWPLLLDLPLPIRFGLGIAGIGLLVVFATVVHDSLTADQRSLEEHLGGDK
ncbi:hypothetical protein [Wenzhouxiangella limi]|uniref:Uncharacterized protein n=1 Tax=Wenzhouxiangella limi TaxID=2707351 RepID=A0A845UVL3_9GAMM|nr:hypothetical protein [Wenzhouxiangella limi]NDY95517.1 hypothetical protein [Wenzhouxiangella limi]